ncbi:MAG TPA: oligosaccharide flippase family protein [bacterium]|nr:oligosaccharide flippase family protein [bacterium]
MGSKNLIFSSIVQIVGYAVGLIATFVLMPYMIGKLGDYYYGLWVVIITITGYFALSEFGVSSAVQNKLSTCLGENDADGFNRIFSNGYFLYIIISLIIVCLITISALIVLILRERFLEPYLVIHVLCITGLNMAIVFLFNPYLSILKSHIRFDIVGWIVIFQTIMNSAMTIIVLSIGCGLEMVAFIHLLVGIASNLLVYFAAKKISPRIRFRKEHVNQKDLAMLLSYSGKTFMSQIGDIMKMKVDEVVTGAFISMSQVTHYAVASRMNRTANGLSMRVLGILTPVFARYIGLKDQSGLKRMFRLSVKISGAYSSFLFAIFIIIGAPFIHLWLGNDYMDAYYPLILLATAFFISGSQAPAVAVLYAMNEHHYYAYMNMFEGLTNLALSLLFVIAFGMGINGVALGTLIPVLFTKLVAQPLIVTKLLNINRSAYYAILAGNLVTGALIYSFAYFVLLSVSSGTWHMLIVKGIILFIALLIHFVIMLSGSERELIICSIKKVAQKRMEATK